MDDKREGDFDLNRYRLNPDKIPSTPMETEAPKKTKRARKPRRCFAILPCYWADQLDKATHAVTFKVANRLLRESFMTNSDVIALSTTSFDGALARRSKFRGLEELQALGLVTFERRQRKVPLVHLHHLD